MKSAYELAMERLEKEKGPAKKLNDDQRAEIAEIENKYEADAAETRLAYDAKLAAAADYEELAKLREELATTLASLEATRDRKKEEVWNKEG